MVHDGAVTPAWTPQSIAEPIRLALESADIDRFGDLLSPDVTWGPPGAATPTCQNRQQVLRWYRAGRAAGIRAQVRELTVSGDRVLVGLVLPLDGVDQERWQVLRIDPHGVCDIRGYERRTEAAEAAGLGASPA
jgi:ketosteroid isomerase-like protein